MVCGGSRGYGAHEVKEGCERKSDKAGVGKEVCVWGGGECAEVEDLWRLLY